MQKETLLPVTEDLEICHFCDFDSSSKDEVEKHVTAIHGQKVQPVSTSPDLKQIEEVLVTPETVKYLCELCRFTTKDLSTLETHVIQSHQKVKNDEITYISLKDAERIIGDKVAEHTENIVQEMNLLQTNAKNAITELTKTFKKSIKKLSITNDKMYVELGNTVVEILETMEDSLHTEKKKRRVRKVKLSSMDTSEKGNTNSTNVFKCKECESKFPEESLLNDQIKKRIKHRTISMHLL